MKNIVTAEFQMHIPGEEHTVLVVEVETLTSGATMHLWNQDTKEKTDVSVSMFGRLNPNLFETVSSEVLEDISRKRFASYDPTLGSDKLVRVNSAERFKEDSFDDYEGDMILKASDESKSEKNNDYFTPYLLWMPLARYEGWLLSDAADDVEELPEESDEIVEDSWVLSLMGFPDLIIGQANWDDHGAIANLIDMMDDVESLTIVAALQDSEQAERIATFNKIKDTLATINYPEDCKPVPNRLSHTIPDRGHWNRSLSGKIAKTIASLYPKPVAEDNYCIYMQILTLDDVEFAYGFKMPVEPTKTKRFRRGSKDDSHTQLLRKLAETGLSPVEIKIPDEEYFWVSLLKEDESKKLLQLPIAKFWEYKNYTFEFQRLLS